MYTADELIQFVNEVKAKFAAAQIHCPVHFPGGNEEALIEIFSQMPRGAWVFSAWRSIYHALLHGIPQDVVMTEIMSGRAMIMNFPTRQFFASSIVGGILPIACGVASQGHEVYCFVGDMTASIGAFYEAERYAKGHDLPITFVIEDNGLATNTPTIRTWGDPYALGRTRVIRYHYERVYPHVGLEEKVIF